jgi:hypothetical protein
MTSLQVLNQRSERIVSIWKATIEVCADTYVCLKDAVIPAHEVLKLGTRRSDRSWATGEAEEDDFDPFADVSWR